MHVRERERERERKMEGGRGRGRGGGERERERERLAGQKNTIVTIILYRNFCKCDSDNGSSNI